MFDELLRELRHRGGRHEVVVSLSSDEEGFFDRECPSPECQFKFKVHEEDWRDKVRQEEAFCPFCGHAADADHWWTQEQLEHAESVAQAKIDGFMGDALKRTPMEQPPAAEQLHPAHDADRRTTRPSLNTAGSCRADAVQNRVSCLRVPLRDDRRGFLLPVVRAQRRRPDVQSIGR